MEVEELQKTTIAQQMAEKYLNEPSKVKATILPEYQSHAKVFFEKEAKQFPLSRE